MTIPASDALLSDAEIAHIRPVRPGDVAALRDLHARVSTRTLYLRYFTACIDLDSYVSRLVRAEDEAHEALVSIVRGRVVAVAAYERLADPTVAEVAFLVDDEHQGLGIGTLLLEHLAAGAAARGIHRFVAETLPDNAAMLAVFRDAGFAVRTRFDDGQVAVEFPVRPDEAALAAADEREARADHLSVHHLLAPDSVVVVGAGRDPRGLGHQVLANLVAGGYTGSVHAVNAHGGEVCGVPGALSLMDVPDPVDLVVVAVPAPRVLEVARQAARRGARSLVVITAGFAEVGAEGERRQHELLAVCRQAGMRLVGPNCMGVASNVDRVCLNATFSPTLPTGGGVGLMSQSGAVGVAALQYAARTGVGFASFVSAGNKADISGNDLLCFWERDPSTTVCALYLESLGNPRKFARIARRVGRSKPVVAVKSGRSVAGTRGARSHTAAAATPEVAVDALFAQAGVIRAESLAELFDIVTLVDRSPLPRGRRVGIVGNSGGPGVLAADACEAAGLSVPELSGATRRTVEAMLPPGATAANPVDLLAGANPDSLRVAIRAVLDDPDIDAVIAIYTPVHPGSEEEMAAAMVDAARGAVKPVLAVILGVADTPAALRDAAGRPRLAFHAFPETAARALGAVARYAAWRSRPQGQPAVLDDVDEPGVRALVDRYLALRPAGGWLSADLAVRLVRGYGVPTAETVTAQTADEAAAAAGRFGGPVVLKAAAGDLVHKTDLGAVRLGLGGAAEVRAAFTDMATRLGPGMGGAVVQPMAPAGVETAVGVVSDANFGPLVMFGLGGVASDLLADRAFRILPLTRLDATEQVRAVRSAPLLFGYRGSEPVDTDALEEILLRVARLADDVPELAELDLNPVVARPDGALVLDVKARVTPVTPRYPFLRRLRG